MLPRVEVGFELDVRFHGSLFTLSSGNVSSLVFDALGVFHVYCTHSLDCSHHFFLISRALSVCIALCMQQLSGSSWQTWDLCLFDRWRPRMLRNASDSLLPFIELFYAFLKSRLSITLHTVLL